MPLCTWRPWEGNPVPRGDFPLYAYDEDLIAATRDDGKTRVRVYRLTDTLAVLGCGSNPEVELNLDACRADGVAILRRRGGGCSVIIDPGNLIVSVSAAGLPFARHRDQLDMLSTYVANGLARIGFPGVTQKGISDLTVGDLKIGGSCLHRSRDLLYYSTTLLFAPDLAKVERYLAHPPREPAYRKGRAHSTFMGSLSGKTGDEVDLEQIARRLRETLDPPDLQHPPAVPAVRQCMSRCRDNHPLRGALKNAPGSTPCDSGPHAGGQQTVTPQDGRQGRGCATPKGADVGSAA